MDVDKVVNGLKNAEKKLAPFSVVVYRNKALDVPEIRESIIDAIALIEQQDITIRAMMGEFGDACDADCEDGV